MSSRVGIYYALPKHKGKQIPRSIETSELVPADRNLPGVRRHIEETDPDLTRRTLEDHKRDPDRGEEHDL